MTAFAVTVLLLVVFLLPGVTATWGYERTFQAYSRQSKDWGFRLAGIAGVAVAVMAPVLYWIARHQWAALKSLEELPWWMALVPILYLAIPALLGAVVGRARHYFAQNKREWWMAWPEHLFHFIFGAARSHRGAPTAWDYLFEQEESGMVRCKLRESGRWVGGLFGSDQHGSTAYASPYVTDRDLYLRSSVQFDQETGLPLAPKDHFTWLAEPPSSAGLLVKWEDIETLEFTDIRDLSRERDER